MDMLYLVEMMVLQFANFSNLTESNIHYSIHIPSIVHKIPSWYSDFLPFFTHTSLGEIPLKKPSISKQIQVISG